MHFNVNYRRADSSDCGNDRARIGIQQVVVSQIVVSEFGCRGSYRFFRQAAFRQIDAQQML
jgi:hypothetical protein